MPQSKLASWIEAMRLRTLPVSLSGVLFAAALGVCGSCFRPVPFLLCLFFAFLAQVASNFANEYYDYKAGIDRAGRSGPRRGVTEGDISPEAMKRAAYGCLALACAVGCLLVALYGSLWMYLVGILTAIGVVAYSAGPFPLSRNGLGEAAVVVFFGVIPVTLTCMLMGMSFSLKLFAASVGIGLMGANVLIVNNYRDADDDEAVGKRTLAVIMGRRVIAAVYLLNGVVALWLTLSSWPGEEKGWWVVPPLYFAGHVTLFILLLRRSGSALNPLLGLTALLMLFFSSGMLITALIN